MTITKKFNGAWEVRELRGNHLVTRIYYFMTKREAAWSFRQEFKSI